MRVVLDTNVVVSALLWGGRPFELLRAAVDGDLILCTSPALLAELRDVLARDHLAERLKGRQSSVDQAVTLYAGLALCVTPEQTPAVVAADADDDHVIAAAVAAQAELIVSGDRHLLTLVRHQGIAILTPADALRWITERSG